jgi:glycine betaine/proline transport system ATP-binding protein
VLKKTIVFITHDFDEAIRLADRIAIMKDGAIVQCGTPQELVLEPATDYVAEFTRSVARAKVVKVATIMKPSEGAATTVRVSARATVADIAPLFASAGEAITVVDEEGDPVGMVHRDDVVNLMMQG